MNGIVPATGWAGRLAADRAARAAAAVLCGVVLLVAIGPSLSPWPYDAVDFDGAWGAAPGLAGGHWLGTDEIGRDLFARVCQGGRISLLVGVAATLVALLVGVAYGAAAGYAGGRVDALMMRAVDVLYALPFMFLVVLLTVLFGRHLLLIFAAIGGVYWLDMARIVRGQTLSLRRREFVEAARVAGAPPWRIVRRHIVPNLLGVVVVGATLTMPQVILVESFLSFLGLGVAEPATSWGALVSEGAHAMETAPWSLVFPAALLALTLLCLNVLGDALRDALDPGHAHAAGPVRPATAEPAAGTAAALEPAQELLVVQGLRVDYPRRSGLLQAVRGVDLRLARGGTLGIVGESGCGKSQTALALLGLLPAGARPGGSVRLQGRELLGGGARQWRGVRGRVVGLVPQEPMTSLNPCRTIGAQLDEVARCHGLGGAAARAESLRMLDAVRIAGGAARLRQFPHELSGGMRQRVLIALALLPRPALLVADEPTTALDVTVQAEILALLGELQRALGMALILITHDLEIAAGACDRVLVMYAGRAVEEGAAAALWSAPRHPYTAGLLACRLRAEAGAAPLPIPGQPPDAARPPGGCAFHPRCARAQARCRDAVPAWRDGGDGRGIACHDPLDGCAG
ncbi:MAG: ABC transporter permease subunit [Nevskia sp.]|nr:ABC transporter permease subunit [Nevskia sp.]